MYVFGGCAESAMNDLHRFDFGTMLRSDEPLIPMLSSGTVTWSRIRAAGSPPSPRESHAAVAIGSQLFIIGGRNDGALTDVHCFDTGMVLCNEQNRTP